jgi:hypothetical protein
MYGEGDAARRALQHLAARNALQEVGEASTIQQQDHLLPSRQPIGDGIVKQFRPRQ